MTSERPNCPNASPLGLSLIEPLQKVVRSEFKLLVSPFRRTELTGDQAHAMHTAKVSVHKSVPRFGVVVSTVGETQMPLAVLLPRVALEVGVFVVGTWLTLPQSLFKTY